MQIGNYSDLFGKLPENENCKEGGKICKKLKIRVLQRNILFAIIGFTMNNCCDKDKANAFRCVKFAYL